MRITVLLGGTSSERDVSLASGIRVVQALRECGHTVTAVDPGKGLLSAADEAGLLVEGVVKTIPPSEEEALRQMARDALPRLARLLPGPDETDCVFLALHGGHGEDGTVQALLDLIGTPYTGSGHLASALGMDKDLSKHLFRAGGVLTADWFMLRSAASPSPSTPAERADVERRALGELGLPLIVKPSKQGSTVGLSVVKEGKDLGPAIDEAFNFDDEVMIERFIAGRELTVGILGGRALPVGEIFPKHEIYDYECKYTPGMVVEVFPADLDADAVARVQDSAQKAFAALKLRGYARIDYRMSPDGEFYCLEANTLPGMTNTSLIPQAAAAAGMSFPELCNRIVHIALERGVRS